MSVGYWTTLEITEALDGFFLGPDSHPGLPPSLVFPPWLVGLVNAAALWYVRPNLSPKGSFVDVSSLVVIGFPTTHTQL